MIGREHIKPGELKALKAGVLSPEEVIAVLEHMGGCERCADAYGDSYSNSELLYLSPDFTAEVFSVINKERIRLKPKEKSRCWKKEFYFFSFKVGVAASIALVLLFSGTLNYGVHLGRTINPDLSGVNVITESLRGFSDKLIDLRLTTNLKEEM